MYYQKLVLYKNEKIQVVLFEITEGYVGNYLSGAAARTGNTRK